MRIAGAACAALCLCAIASGTPGHRVGSFRLQVSEGPYISGSRIPISAAGVSGTFSLASVGPGRVEGTTFIAPFVRMPTNVTLVGAAAGAVALRTLRIVPPPSPKRDLIAVASYDGGVALHDAHTFAFLGFAAIGGPPGDVAFEPDGTLFAPDTDGETLTHISRSPWNLDARGGVLLGNEVLVDPRTGDAFVSNRDVGGSGAVTRLTPDGKLMRVATGLTAEGLALDERRGRLYVGNVNDGTVAEVDARTMQVVRKLPSVPRTFGVALDARDQRLFVVSNASRSMIAGGGYVGAIDVQRARPQIAARSAPLTFPLGVAFDAARGRVFVTDEASDEVYVLSPKTLRAVHAPLRSCRTPWRPRLVGGRLFVPCARSARVDVFDSATLTRVRGAPFATGGFPLGVAAWRS